MSAYRFFGAIYITFTFVFHEYICNMIMFPLSKIKLFIVNKCSYYSSKNKNKFTSHGNVHCIAMKKFISLLIISQAFSMMANLITNSLTNGKHRNLCMYCTWYSILWTKGTFTQTKNVAYIL